MKPFLSFPQKGTFAHLSLKEERNVRQTWRDQESRRFEDGGVISEIPHPYHELACRKNILISDYKPRLPLLGEPLLELSITNYSDSLRPEMEVSVLLAQTTIR